MTTYPVLEKGFYNGKIYDPNGKRRVLTVDKPFKKGEQPSWVGAPAKQTAAQAKAAKKQIDDDKADAATKEKEVKAASFIESPKSTVETL